MDQSKDLPNNAIKTRFVFQHHSLTYKGTTYYLQSINSIGKGGQKGKGLRESSLKTSPMTSWHCQPPLEGQQKSSQPSLKCFSLAIYKQNYLDYRHTPFKFHEAVTPYQFVHSISFTIVLSDNCRPHFTTRVSVILFKIQQL